MRAGIAIPAIALVVGLLYFGGGMGGESGKGWSTKPGVVLTPSMRAFLDRLSAASGGVALLVTSGGRTPEEQAQAMGGKVAAGATRDDLFALYDDGLMMEIWPPGTPWDTGRAVQILRAQVARGAFISGHLRLDALDLSVSGLSPETQGVIVREAKRLGARTAIIEKNPDHIHIGGV
jgi:hypothetical protein